MTPPIDPIQVLATSDDAEFIAQVLLYFDGALDPEDVAALSAALRNDAARRDLFVSVACFRQHLRRLERGQASQPLLLAPGIGEPTEDLEVLLSHLPVEPADNSYKLAEAIEDAPASRPEACQTGDANEPPADEPGEKEVLLNFAGIYVYRKGPNEIPSAGGGLKLKHLIAAAACFVLALGLAWLVLSTPPAPPAPLPVVATIIGQRDAGWDQPNPIQVGGVLRQNDTFSITTGLLHIQTLRGATVLAEAPCQVQFLDENRLSLTHGKLVAQVLDARAHGFTVDTPTAQLIDLGTEFGIVVDAGATTRTAVFDGKVILAGQASGAASAPQLQLTAGRTARSSANGHVAEDPTPSAELANSFRWSLDRQAIPDHVAAYWRFEDAPIDERMPHQDGNDHDRARIAAKDWSGNDNHLYAFDETLAPWGCDQVPRSVVPEPRLFNLRSMRNYGSELQTRSNLYTRGNLKAEQPPIELEPMDRWTIEASVNFADTAVTQSLITKQYRSEAMGPSAWLPNAGCVLMVQMRGGRIEVEMLDDDGNKHALTASRRLEINRWYHIAVVFDGHELSLYVRSDGDPQYTQDRMQATIRSASLTLPEATIDPDSPEHPVEWNVGGLVSQEQNALALIDEVRISREALTADQLLFASRGDSSAAVNKPME